MDVDPASLPANACPGEAASARPPSLSPRGARVLTSPSGFADACRAAARAARRGPASFDSARETISQMLQAAAPFGPESVTELVAAAAATPLQEVVEALGVMSVAANDCLGRAAHGPLDSGGSRNHKDGALLLAAQV